MIIKDFLSDFINKVGTHLKSDLKKEILFPLGGTMFILTLGFLAGIDVLNDLITINIVKVIPFFSIILVPPFISYIGKNTTKERWVIKLNEIMNNSKYSYYLYKSFILVTYLFLLSTLITYILTLGNAMSLSNFISKIYLLLGIRVLALLISQKFEQYERCYKAISFVLFISLFFTYLNIS